MNGLKQLKNHLAKLIQQMKKVDNRSMSHVALRSFKSVDMNGELQTLKPKAKSIGEEFLEPKRAD